MRKFILIDPSIRELGGHYYEYAARVLGEAGRRGFEAILGVNRDARDLESGSWRIVPVYRYGFFEPGPPRLLRWAHRMAARALGSVGTSLSTVTSQTGADGRSRDHSARFRRKREAFFADSVRLFETVPLSAGDVVFLPTVADADMLGLVDFFRADCRAMNAAWHLLFRRDIPLGGSALQRLRKHFEQVHSQLLHHRVFFYTDTEPLTAQYNGLGRTIFRTLPIPTQSARSHATKALKLAARDRLRHVVYLGDARTEKGYHWLPRLAVDAKMAGLQARFTFQSNFSIPGGESAAVKARAELQALSPDYRVTLLTEALSSDAYFRLLLSADVVVIPYHAAAYKARSSGVFAEALAVGKPVIVPEGTWMADELRGTGGKSGVAYRDARDLVRHLARILAEYDAYRAAAQDYSRPWSAYHSPQRLLQQLATRSSHFDFPTGLAPHAILI
jgi:glycosyltransferase involved in cell wall biosynthesis